MATTEEMDEMYRWTRYVYDFTRKYYLLRRERLLRDMELHPGNRVLEIGCGTARNLIRPARQTRDGSLGGRNAVNRVGYQKNNLAPVRDSGMLARSLI